MVEELTYASPGGGRVTATLVTSSPDSPGLVFLHWGFGHRRSFLSEALAIGCAGASVLLIDAPGMGDRGRGLPRLCEEDIAHRYIVQCVTDVRRGIDLLVEKGADQHRLAYVGHSLGATVGGPLVGVEPRLRSAVLMAGFGDISTGGWALRPSAAYSAALRPLDGTLLIRNSQAAIYFQFATRDEYISKATAQRYINAAHDSRRVSWYDADYRLSAEASRDRAAWLVERLDLHPPSPRYLDAVRLPRGDIAKYLLTKPLFAAASRFAKPTIGRS